MLKFKVLLILSVIISSCSKNKSEEISGKSWISLAEEQDFSQQGFGGLEIIDFTNEVNNLMFPISFMDFQKDGTYSLYFSNYDYGKWENKDSLIILKSLVKSKTDTIYFEKAKGDTLTLFIHENNSVGAHEFIGFENTNDINENPFLVENNKWRIRAEKKENDKEIIGRLLNHFRYYELYFNLGTIGKLKRIDARNLPSPIQITNYGFSPIPAQSQSTNWEFYFHSQEDFMRSNKLIDDVFRSEKVKWNTAVTPTETYSDGFKQLQAIFRKKYNIE